jgi:hypothetical protein
MAIATITMKYLNPVLPIFWSSLASNTGMIPIHGHAQFFFPPMGGDLSIRIDE